jgi:hypothetical protein
MRFLLLFVLSLGALPGCQSLPQIRGANFVQSPEVPWDSPEGRVSMERLRDLGANWIAFVPFIEQSTPSACNLEPTASSKPESLERAIAQARSLGFKVAVKPQVLITGSWAGAVESFDEAGWDCWFAAYRRAVLKYASLARESGAEMFVLGTELKKTEQRSEWIGLVAAVRSSYAGPLSYVFHRSEDAQRFSALAAIDLVGVSVYLPIGPTEGKIPGRILDHSKELKASLSVLGKPVWIAEVGYPSRVGAGDSPWEWNERVTTARQVDTSTQAQVLDMWLEKLNGEWNQGMMIWNWMSDPAAGGPLDTDFTPQNKPAEAAIACRWKGVRCGA